MPYVHPKLIICHSLQRAKPDPNGCAFASGHVDNIGILRPQIGAAQFLHDTCAEMWNAPVSSVFTLARRGAYATTYSMEINTCLCGKRDVLRVGVDLSRRRARHEFYRVGPHASFTGQWTQRGRRWLVVRWVVWKRRRWGLVWFLSMASVHVLSLKIRS